MKKTFGRVVLAGAIALGGLGVANLTPTVSHAAEFSTPAYEQGGFIETYVGNNLTGDWTYVNDGDTVILPNEGGAFSWVIDAYGGEYVLIKHYLNGQLVEERTEYKDPDTLSPVQYWDVSAVGKHTFTEEAANYPGSTVYGFTININ